MFQCLLLRCRFGSSQITVTGCLSVISPVSDRQSPVQGALRFERNICQRQPKGPLAFGRKLTERIDLRQENNSIIVNLVEYIQLSLSFVGYYIY